MTRALASLLTLVACASQVPTHESFQGVGEPVPQNVLDDVLPDVIADLEECAGMLPGTLDGWSFYYPAELGLDGRFACGEVTECGPLPEGCSCAAECPCRCEGLSLLETKQIVVTPDLMALPHELVHVLGKIVVHSDPIWDRCML